MNYLPIFSFVQYASRILYVKNSNYNANIVNVTPKNSLENSE